MTFLARGVCGSRPMTTCSPPGPCWTIFSTSSRILRRSMSRFFSTLAATPEPSFTSPSRMCSVPMYSWLNRWASWLASCITLRARSVNRSYIYAVSHGGMYRRLSFGTTSTRETLRLSSYTAGAAPTGEAGVMSVRNPGRACAGERNPRSRSTTPAGTGAEGRESLRNSRLTPPANQGERLWLTRGQPE